MDDNSPSGCDYGVIRASLDSAHAYTAGFNPHLDYLPFIDRFELHLENWSGRWGDTGSSREGDDAKS